MRDAGTGCRLWLAVVAGLTWGCESEGRRAPGPLPPPTVKVLSAHKLELADTKEFIGRTEATQSVEIRSRVSGYLQEILFTAGSEVEAGQPLFRIDPRIFQAEVARSEGSVALALARQKLANSEFERTKSLRERQVTSQADFEKVSADLAEAVAAQQLADASLQRARLDLDFTQITSPIAGHTSRERISVGNLVTADSTLLTTVVNMDPMYVYFDIDELTMLELTQAVRSGKIPKAKPGETPIRLGLANEVGFPHVGTFSLADNSLSASTGTIQVRGSFANPGPEHPLFPGLFVRVEIALGPPTERWLIPEQALVQQQGQRFLMIVKEDQTVERRPVTVGRSVGSWRVVETGITDKDSVIVQGHQRTRPGQSVTVQPCTDFSPPDVKPEVKPEVNVSQEVQ